MKFLEMKVYLPSIQKKESRIESRNGPLLRKLLDPVFAAPVE